MSGHRDSFLSKAKAGPMKKRNKAVNKRQTKFPVSVNFTGYCTVTKNKAD